MVKIRFNCGSGILEFWKDWSGIDHLKKLLVSVKMGDDDAKLGRKANYSKDLASPIVRAGMFCCF